MKRREVNEHEVELIQSTIEDNSDKETGVKKKKKLLKIAGTVVGAAVLLTTYSTLSPMIWEHDDLAISNVEANIYSLLRLDIDTNKDGLTGSEYIQYSKQLEERVRATKYGIMSRKQTYEAIKAYDAEGAIYVTAGGV